MPTNLDKWDVEDEQFWNSEGKKIAARNLWISIPSLLCGFAVWLYWGIIAVQILVESAARARQHSDAELLDRLIATKIAPGSQHPDRDAETPAWLTATLRRPRSAV